MFFRKTKNENGPYNVKEKIFWKKENGPKINKEKKFKDEPQKHFSKDERTSKKKYYNIIIIICIFPV